MTSKTPVTMAQLAMKYSNTGPGTREHTHDEVDQPFHEQWPPAHTPFAARTALTIAKTPSTKA